MEPSLSARGSRWSGAWVVLLAAAVATVPVVLRRPYCGDDYQFHLISWLDALASWRHGIPYPHWTPSANYGAGEPRFVFYPPLVWMLGAALGVALPWSWVPVALTFLLLAATGLATLALARQVLPAAPATLAGCAAVLSGYGLFTAYERSAFGEMAGGFWIPLLLLFELRERDAAASFWRRVFDGSAVPLALVVAGCWLSDLPVGVMGAYLLAAVALIAAVAARSWVPVARAAIATALGLALAGVYLVPAIWEQRWVDVSQATGAVGDPGLLIENHWLFFPGPTPPALNVQYAEERVASLVTASMLAVALAGVVAFWLRRKPVAEQRRWWIPLGRNSGYRPVPAIPHFATGVESAAQAALPAVPLALAAGAGSADGNLLCGGAVASGTGAALGAWRRSSGVRGMPAGVDGGGGADVIPCMQAGGRNAAAAGELPQRRGVLGGG